MGTLPLSLTPSTPPQPCSRTAWVPQGVHLESQLLRTNRQLAVSQEPCSPRGVGPGQLTKASPTLIPLSYSPVPDGRGRDNLGQKEREERFLHQQQTHNPQPSPALTTSVFQFQNHHTSLPTPKFPSRPPGRPQ